MKLHDLLDDILDSKSKVRILRLLFSFPDRDFTEREIAGMIGMSPNTVNLALNDLRRTNIFEYKRIGRAHAYRCDRESVLFPIMDGLFTREKEVADDLVTMLKDALDGVGTCILYGSFARREETFDSDLDLIIVTEDKDETEVIIGRLAETVSRRFSTTLAAVILTPEEFERKRKKGFVKEAVSEGEVLVGNLPP